MQRSRIAWTTCLCGAAFAALLLFAIPSPSHAGPPPAAQTDDASNPDQLLPLNDLSPGLLGMYRKTMEIEGDIRRHTEKYGVDIDLARAVCLHESGGNGNLSSHAGARGYFQVMPATFRSLRVETNIEAGIKYLSQMIRQFGREDYALGAYNAGPGRVRRGRPPLETLQYILAVGQYRNVLMLHERSIRHYAEQMRLATVRGGDDWWSLSRRLGLPLVQLRMHNPFLATRRLREGQVIAYPPAPRTDLLVQRGDSHVEYRTRHGDNILHIAFVLEADRDKFREDNRLWRLQTLPAGQLLQIPMAREKRRNAQTYRVQAGDDIGAVARQHKSSAWRIIRDNGLWDERLTAGAVLRIERQPPRPAYATHRVRSGDTLGALARRYGTSVRAIQAANNLGRRTVIGIGQRLRMPTSRAAADAEAAARPVARAAPEPEQQVARASEPPPAAPTAARAAGTHRVVRGDNLTALARRYGTTVRAIQAANDMGRRTVISIGQELRLPGGGSPRAQSAPATHSVQRGDTLGKIAERYGTTVRALQAANNLGRRTVINVGQRLRIPGN